MQECSKHRLHTASLQSDVGSIAVREAQAAPYSLLFYKNRASVAEAIAKGEGGGGAGAEEGERHLALSIVLAPSETTTGAGDTAAKASLMTLKLVE